MGQLIFLSLIQSLTEFLPISSSGHLLLMKLFQWTDQGLGVDVALHVGTLVAVVVYFWRDIFQILCFKNISLMMQLIVATIPVVAVGLCLRLFKLELPESALLIGICLIAFGWLLWRVDEKYPCRRKIDQMTYRDAFLIGCAQVLALIPGTSRSGITMTCARWRGLKREESARFSMLLSIPTIALAGLDTAWQAFKGHITLPPLTELSVAMAGTVIFGLCAIVFLMKWVQNVSFAIFAWYRIILGFFVLWYFF